VKDLNIPSWVKTVNSYILAGFDSTNLTAVKRQNTCSYVVQNWDSILTLFHVQEKESSHHPKKLHMEILQLSKDAKTFIQSAQGRVTLLGFVLSTHIQTVWSSLADAIIWGFVGFQLTQLTVIEWPDKNLYGLFMMPVPNVDLPRTEKTPELSSGFNF